MNPPHQHHEVPHIAINRKLNWLRAAVLGADDGIVSISAVVVGMAGATNSLRLILTASVAALIAGALSMGMGEYVSVSSQRDTEKALIEKERFELENFPEEELNELTSIYEKKGLSKKTARIVAEELTIHDVHAAHFHAELGIDPNNLTNPWHAAYASTLAFFFGGVIPLITISISPESIRIPITFITVILVLVVIGILSAHAGEAKKTTAVMRVVAGGLLAMIITYSIGKLFGVTGI